MLAGAGTEERLHPVSDSIYINLERYSLRALKLRELGKQDGGEWKSQSDPQLPDQGITELAPV